MKSIGRISLVLALSLFVGIVIFNSMVGAKTEASWPQWRGPSGQGVSLEKNLPATWSTNKNIKWKAAIPGRGHSSPIVWGNRIFLTTAVEGELVPGAKAAPHVLGDKPLFTPTALAQIGSISSK
jgi:hypothetical protein